MIEKSHQNGIEIVIRLDPHQVAGCDDPDLAPVNIKTLGRSYAGSFNKSDRKVKPALRKSPWANNFLFVNVFFTQNSEMVSHSSRNQSSAKKILALRNYLSNF